MTMDRTPDQLLAQEIIADLRADRLLAEKQMAGLAANLESGKLKPEDWRVIVEMAVDSQQGGKNAKAN